MTYHGFKILLLCASWHIIYGQKQANPRIKSSVEGRTPLWILAPSQLRLECQTDIIRDTTEESTWTKDGQDLTNNKHYKKEWSVLKKESEKLATSTLIVTSTRPSDSGKYTCKPKDGGEATVHVEVLSVTSTNANITDINADVVILKCEPENLKKKQLELFSWTKNGSEFSEEFKKRSVEHNENYTLEITKPTREDAGQYECVFGLKYDEEGTNKPGVHNLVQPVHLYAPPLIKKLPTSDNLVEDDTLIIDCLVMSGHPLPKITWLKGSKPVDTSDDRVRLGMPKKHRLPVLGAQLKIFNLKYSDRAIYYCIAQNSFGSYNVSTLIRVKDKLAPLWPFLAIVAEVIILCAIIFVCEKKKTKTKEDDDEITQKFQPDSVENKGKDDVRQRKT